MIQIAPQMRILVAVEAVDFRKASTAWPVFAKKRSRRSFFRLLVRFSQPPKDGHKNPYL
jgi:hypothetical protein